MINKFFGLSQLCKKLSLAIFVLGMWSISEASEMSIVEEPSEFVEPYDMQGYYYEMPDYYTARIRSGGFFPTQKNFSKIYGSANADIQLEFSSVRNKKCEIWFNLEYFQRYKEKHNYRTTIRIIDFSLGTRYFFSHVRLFNHT